MFRQEFKQEFRQALDLGSLGQVECFDSVQFPLAAFIEPCVPQWHPQDEFDPGHHWAGPCCARGRRTDPYAAVTAQSVHYYITNLPVDTGAARVADLVRSHWWSPPELSFHGCGTSMRSFGNRY